MSFLNQHLGEAAALGTATCWVFSSLAFAGASRRIGPTAVNTLRILVAWSILIVVHRVAIGRWVPQVDHTGVLLLACSGIVGFALSDQFLFQAFVDIGPRLSTLMLTLTPPVAVGLAWVALEEPLTPEAVIGIGVTVAGIGWVALERPDPRAALPQPHRLRGLTLAGLAAASQATGLILAKLGIGHTRLPASMHLDPWSASLTRITFGAAAIVFYATLRTAWSRREKPRSGQPGTAVQTPVPRVVGTALLLAAAGAVLGPVVGVWCSLVAVDRAHAGVAMTLMAMTPVFILPFAVWIEKERLSWRAAAGAAIAVLGVAILTVGDGAHRQADAGTGHQTDTLPVPLQPSGLLPTPEKQP